MENKVKVEDLKANIKAEEPKWGYHSYRLNKDFGTLKELQEAEKEFEKAQLEKEQLTQVKREDAAKVEAAFKHFCQIKEAATKEIREATQAIRNAEEDYYKMRNDFIKKYGYYHATYSSENGNEIVSVSDLVDTFFNDWYNFFR